VLPSTLGSAESGVADGDAVLPLAVAAGLSSPAALSSPVVVDEASPVVAVGSPAAAVVVAVLEAEASEAEAEADAVAEAESVAAVGAAVTVDALAEAVPVAVAVASAPVAVAVAVASVPVAVADASGEAMVVVWEIETIVLVPLSLPATPAMAGMLGRGMEMERVVADAPTLAAFAPAAWPAAKAAASAGVSCTVTLVVIRVVSFTEVAGSRFSNMSCRMRRGYLKARAGVSATSSGWGSGSRFS